jgi:hypothetical protein
MTKIALKMFLVLGLPAVLIVSVSGCTSNTSNNSAISIAATQAPVPANVTAYYGEVIGINVTVNNDHAGTLKISTDNFYLTDSGNRVTQPVSSTVTWVTHSGERGWTDVMYFRISPGTQPSKLEYSDGTNDVTCQVS